MVTAQRAIESKPNFHNLIGKLFKQKFFSHFGYNQISSFINLYAIKFFIKEMNGKNLIELNKKSSECHLAKKPILHYKPLCVLSLTAANHVQGEKWNGIKKKIIEFIGSCSSENWDER